MAIYRGEGQTADATAIYTAPFLRITSSQITDLSDITGNETITLSGDVSGSGTTAITVTVADDSHNHIISNVDGLQTALDAKLSSVPAEYLTQTEGDARYLQSFTETNDLTAAVTWANVPNANITQSSVTQHQAALSITESQISDLGTYLADVVSDTTPQLGGNLDVNSKDITGAGNISLTGTSTSTPSLTLTTTEASSSAAPIIELKRNSASPADGDYLGQIKFLGENDADQEIIYAKITGKISDATDGTEDGLIEFAVKENGSNVINARLTNDSLNLINSTALEVDGDVSGTSGSFGDLNITGAIDEAVYNLTGTALDPANGTIQTKTLTGDTTLTDSLSEGEAITLMIDDGSAHTLTFPTITFVNNGGSAPTLATTGYTVFALWKVSTTLYGALVGDGS